MVTKEFNTLKKDSDEKEDPRFKIQFYDLMNYFRRPVTSFSPSLTVAESVVIVYLKKNK